MTLRPEAAGCQSVPTESPHISLHALYLDMGPRPGKEIDIGAQPEFQIRLS
jgi:hypothetical protein